MTQRNWHTKAAVAATTTWWWMRDRAQRMRDDERGEGITSTVILIALFAALALGVGAIIVAKVTDKANSIPTDNAPVIAGG